MTASRNVRFDRADLGALARPRRTALGTIYEAVAARTHAPGDGLHYLRDGRTVEEYRDLDVLRSVVAQLPRAPVTLGHGAGPHDISIRTVGKVISARLDGDRAVVEILVTSAHADAAIRRGQRELSLEYRADLDAKNYQRLIRLHAIALVARARCGDACSLRADCAGCVTCACGRSDSLASGPAAELAATARMVERLYGARHQAGTQTEADGTNRIRARLAGAWRSNSQER